MFVMLEVLGVGSLTVVFKAFLGDGKDRSTGLKVYWYNLKGFGTLDVLSSVVMILMDCSLRTPTGVE